MGLISDVFLATDAALTAMRPGQGGPAGTFPCVQSTRVDPLKLATLEAIVTQQEAGVRGASIDGTLVRDWGEEFVYRLPEALITGLAQLQPGELARCSEMWGATEEWRLDGAASIAGRAALTRLVGELCQLAQRARHEGTSMYLWMSL